MNTQKCQYSRTDPFISTHDNFRPESNKGKNNRLNIADQSEQGKCKYSERPGVVLDEAAYYYDKIAGKFIFRCTGSDGALPKTKEVPVDTWAIADATRSPAKVLKQKPVASATQAQQPQIRSQFHRPMP